MSRTVSWCPALPGLDFPLGEAVFSDDMAYRYVLNRRWGPDGPVMTWICLNPSTADAETDDNSVRRMCGYARREGCRGICVLNAYALRSPSPAALWEHPDPIGPENDEWLRSLARPGAADGPVVAGWGAWGAVNSRGDQVRAMLAPVPLLCLGVTAHTSQPVHPLYQLRDAPLVPLPPLPDRKGIR